ncbi:unnamed protein product [Effrenium voratum]|uniref:Uncharacterized protein n=1 Tax=Effrenium voratum TaxID=2562239 RepID=A0AA36MFQ4_9DINO|nr:unnamed protein product [Effrenium voratum]CAJ1415079.1 unnamed protein product [Effrenium voratum]
MRSLPMACVLRVDQDADVQLLRALEEDLDRIHASNWEVKAVFVNVASGKAEHQREERDELAEQWLQVAETIATLKPPVFGVAMGEVFMPGIRVLDACDLVLATRTHPGTHINHVLPPMEIQTFCLSLIEGLSGLTPAELQDTKLHLVQSKILARLPNPTLRAHEQASASALSASQKSSSERSEEENAGRISDRERMSDSSGALDEDQILLFLDGMPLSL